MLPKGITESSSTSKRKHSKIAPNKEGNSTDDDNKIVQRKTARERNKERASSMSDNEKKAPDEKSYQEPSTSKISPDSGTELQTYISAKEDLEKTDERDEMQSIKSDNTSDDEGLEKEKKESFVEVEEKDAEKKCSTNTESLKQEIQEIEKLWEEIEPKDVSIKQKEMSSPFLYDFLGEEVDKDEAEALEALSLYWLNTVAKRAGKPKTEIPQEHKAFYDKYCNGTRELSVETAMRLMSLPHVVTVTLKSVPKIEVVVSDVVLALRDSPELRNADFEVTEAMGMHLF